MAVEIPVYVDITGGINNAVQQLPKELSKLQDVVDSHTLKMKFSISGGWDRSLETILTSPYMKAKDLQTALNSIRAEFDKISKAQVKNAETSDKIKNLAKAYALVEQRLTGVYNKSTAGALIVQDSINKVTAKLNTLRASLGNVTSTAAYDKINYQIKIQEERLAKLNTQMRAYSISTSQTTAAINQQSSAMGQLNGLLSTYVSIFGLFRFAKQIRDVTAELEYQRVALGHLIQDEEYGAVLFEKIKAAAVESPFRIKDLVTYVKQLAAYRVEQENLYDTTKRLADISAGLGVDMNRLILAYGQVRAASVLRGQELRQFTEAGIPLVELLADKFHELGEEGITTADVFKKISERAVPFSMIAEIFEDLTDKGGTFYEMQITQAQTLKGRWEKLKDAFDIALQSVGETKTFEKYNNIILKSANLLAQNIRIIPKLIEGLTTAWAVYTAAVTVANLRTKQAISYEVALAASQKADATRISTLTLKIFGEAKAREMLTKAYVKQQIGATALSRALGKLTVAMLSNPIFATIAAVSALTVAFTSFRKKADETSYSLEYLDNAIEKISEAEKNFSKREALIDRYEKLASKTELTSKESQRLYNTLGSLRDIFPAVAKKIDEENISLEKQVELLKDANAENRQNARNDAMATYELTKKDIEEAQKKAGKLRHSYEQAYASQRAFEEEGDRGLEKRWRKITEKRKAELDEQEKDIKKMYASLASLDKYLFPEKANKDLAEWQKQVIRIQEEKTKTGETPLFTQEEISSMTSVYDLFTKLKKKMQDVQESLKGMRTAFAQMAEGDAKQALGGDIKDKERLLELIEALQAFFGFVFSKQGGGGSYKKDPFITLMEERMKFMKDFKKGYEDLNKFMSSSMAQETQAGIMMGRGMSLGLSAEEQLRSVKELTNWYSDMIQEVEQKLRDKGIRGNTVTDFLSVDTTTKSRAVQDLQKLLQSLWDAKTDLDTSEKKKEFEEAIKKLAEDIKRSETAKNFFENVLGATGDKEIATNLTLSLYGEPGEELGERIKEDIEKTLQELKIPEEDSIYKKLMEAADKQDFRDLVKDIKSLPEQLQPVVLRSAQAIEKYNSQTAQSYVKLLYKFDELTQKRIDIEKQADDQIKTLREGLALELKGIEENESIQDKASAKAAAQAREKAAEEGVERERELKLFQLKRDYRLFFESVGTLSLDSARKIARAERMLITEQFNAGQLSLSQFYRELSRIDEQLKKYENERNPLVTYLTKGFDGLFDKIKQVGVNLTALTGNLKDDEGNFSFPEGLEKTINALGAVFGGKFFGVENVKGRKNVFDQMKEQLGENQQAWQEMAEKTEGKLSSLAANWARGIGWADFWVSFAGGGIKAFDNIAQHSKNTEGEVKEGWNKVAKAIMVTGAGPIFGPWGTKKMLEAEDAWERLTSLNEKAMSGFEKFKSGDLIGALTDNVEGWMEVFGKNTKQIDRQIKEQSNLIEDLEYSYSRLDVAIQKAFGSDYIYNYNKQLEALQAQAEAYRKQAELEYSKGSKKRDQNKIDEYNKQARDIEDKIADMQTQLSEFMTGTDLTSAAKEFAESWIEAYKEFGSTTDAMKEKFNDMIENMVVNSLAAQLIQGILQPIFDQIDTASHDGELSAQEIAAISEQIPSRVDMINNAMSTMMNELLASGVNLRDQAGSMTGISRSIAGASEESINGLAAGINTQNFYMQHIDANVAAILATLTGGTTTAGSGTTGEYVDPYKDEMLTYVGSLPQMRDDMASIRDMLEKVIRPNGTTATHYVAARM